MLIVFIILPVEFIVMSHVAKETYNQGVLF